jgi:prevent-host-death family protein
MQKLTANEAKTHFGQLLLKAQSEPVQIDKNGKPVAVLLSMQDYEAVEKLKLEWLKSRLHMAEEEIKSGQTTNGDEFFQQLISGELDE